MSEIFVGSYDQIFLQDTKREYDDEIINNIAKQFLESNATVLEKSYFIKLKNQYFRIKGIKDYNLMQKKLYNNKTKNQIILFEIARISNNENLDTKVSEQISDIKRLLQMHGDNLPDESYERICNVIIKIELSFGMRIGLFNELCNLFECETNRIEQELNAVTAIYTKRK